MLAIMIEQGRVFVCTCTLVFFCGCFLVQFFLMYVPVRFLVPLVLSERSKYERIQESSLTLFPRMPSFHCRYLFTSLLYSQDIIRRTESHQQALIALLNEHSSLFGLKVKVLNRDEEDFPGGWHYHRSGMSSMMRDMVGGKASPYIFHMSWTNNKVNKIKFFQQMGDWYVSEKCIAKSVQEIHNDNPLQNECCLVSPLVVCHYRDKPSIKPCRESPPIDKGRPSWWKD